MKFFLNTMEGRKRYLFIVFLFCIIFFRTFKIHAQTYGLAFHGQEVTLDKRTELNLTPDKLLKFNDEFELSFDYKIDSIRPNSIFGYIFRIINTENINVDLISTPSPDIGLNLIIGKNNSILPVSFPYNYLNNWINLRVKFLLSDDKMIFYTPDSLYVWENIGFKKQDEFKIIFGANDFNIFKTTDVPAMDLKDIKIFEQEKLKYHWPLNLKEGNIVTDKLKNRNAYVKNPSWLMLTHQTWQSNFESEVNGPLMVAFDQDNERIFMIGKEELLIYSGENNTVQKVTYQNTPLFLNSNYKSIYNSNDNRIYTYQVEDTIIYSLNIVTGKWNKTGTSTFHDTEFTHHNSFFYPPNNSILLFGGWFLPF